MSIDGPVLVVGGTGMLGGQVVTALLSRGKRVRALVRPASDAAPLEQAEVEIARGDMMDPASLDAAMNGADEVVTTAAGYTRHSKGDTAEIDTTGNRNLVDAASRAGIRRFVLTSILTCDQTPQVPHFWHKKLTEDRLEAQGVPFVALRPGAFLDAITRMGGDPFAKGRLMWFGSPTIPLTVVLTRDLAGYLADAVDAPSVDGERIDIGWEPTREHARGRTDLRAAVGPGDPSAHDSGRRDQRSVHGRRQVQPDGPGHGRDDAPVPNRAVRRESGPPTRGLRGSTHRRAGHHHVHPEPWTHRHGLIQTAGRGIAPLVNGAATLAAPRTVARRLGVDTDPAVVYVLRLFGIRTVILGAEPLFLRGESLERSLRVAPVIYATDTAAAVVAGSAGGCGTALPPGLL